MRIDDQNTMKMETQQPNKACTMHSLHTELKSTQKYINITRILTVCAMTILNNDHR